MREEENHGYKLWIVVAMTWLMIGVVSMTTIHLFFLQGSSSISSTSSLCGKSRSRWIITEMKARRLLSQEAPPSSQMMLLANRQSGQQPMKQQARANLRQIPRSGSNPTQNKSRPRFNGP
ncbi:hypothetical protein QJS10_CPA05g01835 [Acorus calamus]|uniref:Transmembrane protein n=1 Tax=Acorus calamus TaxID=4465 RepID=A0AAV9EPW5_ACOCL|nr:hypothetical protein QJS10_CPA05g01835 [Acorus calamus]